MNAFLPAAQTNAAMTKALNTPMTPEKMIRTEDLFGDTKIMTILHQDMQYTLRITKQGKLLLTK